MVGVANKKVLVINNSGKWLPPAGFLLFAKPTNPYLKVLVLLLL